MRNHLDDVDRMVISLKSVVEGNLDQMAKFKFEICMSEALKNIVKHARTPHKDAPIEVTLSETNSTLVVEVFDPIDADVFDLRVHARELGKVDLMAESGRGLGLIIQCADLVNYSLSGDRHCLELQFLKQRI